MTEIGLSGHVESLGMLRNVILEITEKLLKQNANGEEVYARPG